MPKNSVHLLRCKQCLSRVTHDEKSHHLMILWKRVSLILIVRALVSSTIDIILSDIT